MVGTIGQAIIWNDSTAIRVVLASILFYVCYSVSIMLFYRSDEYDVPWATAFSYLRHTWDVWKGTRYPLHVTIECTICVA